MTTVGVSALFVRSGRVGGAEYMLGNLLDGLPAVRRHDDEVLIFTRDGDGLRRVPAGLRRVELPGGAANRFVQETVALTRIAPRLDALLLPNYFTPPRRLATRVVTVIHDLQYRHYPENFSVKKRLWLQLAHRLTLRRADVVVAISAFTRDDILRSYGDRAENKLRVIANPICWGRFERGEPTTDERALIPREPFVLSVAAHYPHKNLETLIRAFAQVHRRDERYRLVIAGQLPSGLIGSSRYPDLAALVRELGLAGAVVITGHVSDVLMGQLYREARLFVLPSLYEGFGMPAVEALGMGLPVLTTRGGALPEVTRGLAVLLDHPRDDDEMAGRMLEMLAAPALFAPTPAERADLRARYSPERIAGEYWTLLTGRSAGVETAKRHLTLIS